MFEGLVHRVLVGYLGRFVKDFHKNQLKLSLWNEEVLLDNVDLIPEAFDYLQLPFALKQGRVGRLSIKISWKKIGWDHPISIVLEDVFICASQRDDQEWSLDVVERREFAGKKARLAAAELAKLSKRVCDNQAGKSFLSYIAAKVLDNIQVSIRNFHVQYNDTQFDSVRILFGLKFSGLMIRQNLVGSFGGKVVGGQVNKTVNIEGLEIYCCTTDGTIDSVNLDEAMDSKFWTSTRSECNGFDHIVQPFDVSVSLVVNRAGKVDIDLPQYSIKAELTGLVVSLNEVQLQQILILSDYLSISGLREKYGRYRPWGSPLSRKHDGWQILWWHYAQECVLSDVRRKLKKTSWRYFGQRLSYRRKYINLYKKKLEFLQQEQSIDDYSLRELEQMEKESDVDDILSYRSAAESELQELFSKSSSSSVAVNDANASDEKSRNDEGSSGTSQGWLNWLSSGMLGAGGTDDSTQFSGVVSDEVVKDIFEATKFHPLSSGDADVENVMFTCAIKFSAGQISTSLQSKNSGQKIFDLIFTDAAVDCKLGEELAVVICVIKSGEMVYPLNKKVILRMGGCVSKENVQEDGPTTFRMQVDVSSKQEVELSVKVMAQPLEVTYDMGLCVNFMEFFSALKYFESQHERVLLSLNGIEDVKTRVKSKAEYILTNKKKLSWDVSIANITINVPCGKAVPEQCNMVLKLGSLLCTPKNHLEAVSSSIEEQSYILKQSSSSPSINDVFMGFQVQDLYNYFEVQLKDLELKLITPQHAQQIMEKFCASITLASCIIVDELILKQLEVFIILSSLEANFSLSICESAVALIAQLDVIHSKSESWIQKNHSTQNVAYRFGFSIDANLESVSFHVDLANNGEDSSKLVLYLQKLYIGYCHTEFEECWVHAKTLELITSLLRNENGNHILCSLGNQFTSSYANDLDGRQINQACFQLHYESCRKADLIVHKCAISINDADLHCYPYIFGLLTEFYDRISSNVASLSRDKSFSPVVNDKSPRQVPNFEFERFGYSNFLETESCGHASISLDSYPFITVCNSGSLGSLEGSLRYSIAEWRKLFKLRDGQHECPRFILKERSGATSAYKYRKGAFPEPAFGSFCERNILSIDINLYGVRVHFHDSLYIVATITLPTSISSILVDGDSMDLLCSTEGMTLTSSWWTKNPQEFLWGPSLENLSPILNLRVIKGNNISLTSQLEVSIGIQHACCVLPPEYLAIIIGYFSFPGWSSKLTGRPISENYNCIDTELVGSTVYKFEVLDSILILPVEQDHHQFLKVGLPQLYCSFIQQCVGHEVFKDIPPEYLVPAHEVAEANHCLNIFGRDLFLLFMLYKDDEYGQLVLDQAAGRGNITLISPISADVWVRLPCEDKSCFDRSSVSVMSRISSCQLIVSDCYTLDGFEALLGVINDFSLVEEESKCFTSDVLQFLQLKRSRKGNGAVPNIASEMVLTEFRCCIDSLLIELYCSRKDSILSQPIARADMQFIFSASFINETVVALDIQSSSLALYSIVNSVMLAQCTCSCSASHALHVCFSRSEEGENELQISLPSLDVWLYFYDWIELIKLYSSYAKKMAVTVLVEPSSHCFSTDMVDMNENVPLAASQNFLQGTTTIPAFHESEFLKKDPMVLIVRSENIGLSIHFPLCTTETTVSGPEPTQSFSSGDNAWKNCKFISVTTQSRSTEVSIVGGNVKLKSILDKTSGTLGICKGKNITNWPFFQISKINAVAEICSDQAEFVKVVLGFHCDQLDLWLSHRVFRFWYGVSFEIPKAESSHSLHGSWDVTICLRKASVLASDERWSCGGPLLEILLRNFQLHCFMTENSVESSVSSDIEVNYNNIHKVLWEPFVEKWNFQINMIRKHEMTALLNSSTITDINLASTTQLNLNITESFVECVGRAVHMVGDALCLMGQNNLSENQIFLSSKFTEAIDEGRYAPYVLQNLTSLPLVYDIFEGLVNPDILDVSEIKDGKSVQPGASVPIYLNETPEEQLFRYRPSHSSDRLSEKQSNGVVHHFISIQLSGMSLPSAPISMDRVGLTYFEVDFSKASNKREKERHGGVTKYNTSIDETAESNTSSGFLVPVVFDVSVQRHSKLIRLYSTVILTNATSMPLELRFDIPFGVSPKILDPIYPGQSFPLPLHLAEAGRMRWRPLGSSYLWTEVQDLSHILSQESRIGFLRSVVSYPSHRSSDPFRCCISVQNYSFPLSDRPMKGRGLVNNNTKRSLGSCNHDWENSRKRFIHQLTLSTPLVVKNYLADAVSLTIDSGGVTYTVSLLEVETSFHHFDPSHDLGLGICLHGYRPSHLKFPNTESFTAMAKFTGSKFSLTETITFDPYLPTGLLYVTVEKLIDAFSGARELFIYVPFLLYNCSGLTLNISESSTEIKGCHCTIPSCYDLIEQESFQGQKEGLSILSFDKDSCARAAQSDGPGTAFSKNHVIMARRNANSHFKRSLSNQFVLPSSSGPSHVQSEKHGSVSKEASLSGCSNIESNLENFEFNNKNDKVKACMYSPQPTASVSEIMVRVSRFLPEYVTEHAPSSSWSEPFLLVPPSGSSTVLVPQLSSNAAFILSVTSIDLAGPFAGQTRAITFQPRYIISNACSKDLSYKQKGTSLSVHLGIGQHSHLHWTDTTRELLVSIRFNEPGWQWSGSFFPDHLGDTQVKMRDYVSGALKMIRVEVQNADVSVKDMDAKIVESVNGKSGTNLILLSDDVSGFMPYRVDNFTMETLRIHQQRCEIFDTIVQPYASCPYAWDEPSYPHRLVVEVLGERVIGSYAIDEQKEYTPLRLKSTSEKPERTFLLSIHAEGATKVLSIVDSRYHILSNMKDPSPFQLERSKHQRKQESLVDYKQKFSLAIPFIGISLINFHPQELLFACAKNTTLDLLQSLDQQKLSFQISSLQIDNQLQGTPYPVILSFNHEYRSNTVGHRTKDDGTKADGERVLQVSPESSHEPALYLALATWRKKDASLISFEYISLRLANFRLELEQEFILSFLDFFKSVSSRFQSNILPFSSDLIDYPLIHELSSIQTQTCEYITTKENQLHKINFPTFNKSQISGASLPSIVPIGAPWQQIYLPSRKQKIYVELFDLAPIKFTVSFSSAPWILRNGVITSRESLVHRGLMALADVEGAQIYLKRFTAAYQMASWDSMQDILIRFYTRQLLHEMYKVFGSAGVIGNPMGFARNLGLGIRDFLYVPARSIWQSPTGLITGMAQGTSSLVSNTVFAVSDAATQFSKAAQKGIVAFTFDDQSVARMEKQQKGAASQSKGVINEVLEGLTGLLQSPIKGAEKHGLPGVLSGIAFGVTGLVARPAASILEVTGKTAQSVRNRSRLYQVGSQRYRVRLPRPLSRELPLRPYSLVEAIGMSVLMEADDGLKLKDEVLVTCKSLKQAGKFVIITERIMLIVSCASFVDLGKPGFRGVPSDPEWVIESEIGLDSVIHADIVEDTIHIVGSRSDAMLRQIQQQHKKTGGPRTQRWNSPSPLPLFQTDLELPSKEDADDLLRTLLSTLEQGKARGWSGGHVLRQNNIM